MIDDNTSIEWTGINGVATGTVKYNSDFSELYGSAEKSGHFFPTSFNEKYYNKQVVISGRTDGDKTITPSSDDPYLITRIENLSDGKKLTAKVDGTEIFTIDFSGVTLNPAITVLPQDHNLGKYEKIVNELVDENVKIDANGEVTGNLKKVTDFTQFSDEVAKQSGHYLPVRVDKQYMNKEISVIGTKTTKVNVDSESDLDFILRVASVNSTFKFKDGDNEFMRLTFKNAILE